MKIGSKRREECSRSPEAWDLVSYTNNLRISSCKIAIIVYFDSERSFPRVLDSERGRRRRCRNVDELELSS